MEKVANARQRRAFSRHIESMAVLDDKGCRAIELMARYGRIALPALLEASRDRRSLVRCRVALTLGYMGGSVAYDRLVEMTKDRSSRVRYDSYVALGRVGDLKAFRVFLMARKSDRDCAAMGMSNLGMPAWSLVEGLLSSDDEGVVVYALYVLNGLDWERAEVLARDLVNHPSEKVRVAADDVIVCAADNKTARGQSFLAWSDRKDKERSEWLAAIRIRQ